MTEITCPDCGSVFSPKAKGKPRSYDQLRRYFGVIKAVFQHWPESHPRQFGDVEECRAFLQMKAGYRDIAAQIPLVGLPREKALVLVEAAIRSTGSYAMPILYGETMVVFKPKSIAFAKLAHLDFCELNNKVDDVIYAETGLDAKRLLEETKRAA